MKLFIRLLYILLFHVFFSAPFCFSQDKSEEVFHLDSIPAEGILLNKGWKFHPGDNGDWSKREFDDSKWEDINPTLELFYLQQIRKEPVGWFRMHLRLDSSMMNRPWALQVSQSIASEIYWDGELIQRYGTISHHKDEVRFFQPRYRPFGIQFNGSDHVVAIRFSAPKKFPFYKYYTPFTVFELRINSVTGASDFANSGKWYSLLNVLYTGIFIVLTIIHLGLFVFFKREKANLFFSISTLSGAIANGLWVFLDYSDNVLLRTLGGIINYIFLFTLFNLFLFIAVHYLFSRTRNNFFWIVVWYSIGSIGFWFLDFKWGELLAFFIPFAISIVAALGIAWKAYRKEHRGSGIIVIGLAFYLIFYSLFFCIYYEFIRNMNVGFEGKVRLNDVFYHSGMFSVLGALSFYLAREFALTSKELERKLSEVKNLSEKTLAQELEKQQILTSQNETLEKQVIERTFDLNQSLQALKATQSQLIQSEKMASLGELTAGIAHEIQNPLNFVNNFSEVNEELLNEMKDEMIKGNSNEALILADDAIRNQQKINLHGKRADAIVKGMLQHSQTGTGVKEPTDINAFVDEYLRLSFHGFRAKNKEFNATMNTDFDESIGSISIISQDIGRVLLNLFNNALFAVNERKKQSQDRFEPIISVSTKKLDNKVIIRVEDNGTGIPQKVLDKIFQPFFTTKPTGQGTGLGLSLSYDIIKAHQGEIRVNSKEGDGSEFTIVLPV